MQGEIIRRELYIVDIDEVRKEIIGKHKACRGRGIREWIIQDNKTLLPRTVVKVCKCKNKFDLISRFILSNIFYWKLTNQQIYHKIVFDDISSKEIDLRKEVLYPYIKNVREVIKNPYGLLFLGKHGTGKTFVGQKILYYAIARGYTAHYIEFPNFLKLLIRNFEENLEGLINEILSVDILMIDEIGSESKKSDFVIGEFKSLYKKRIQYNKPTIMATNYSYVQFKKLYGKSIESMASSYSRIFDFGTTSDVRKAQSMTGMSSFFKGLSK